MILDTLQTYSSYAAISKNLRTGFEWLAKTDLASLPEGKVVIDGDAVFAQIQHYETIDPSAAKLETHRRYLDIQYVVSGSEIIQWCPLAGLNTVVAYDQERDIEFYADAPATDLVLHPGYFAVFFPQDAHKPRCVVGKVQPIKKIVVKVAV